MDGTYASLWFVLSNSTYPITLIEWQVLLCLQTALTCWYKRLSACSHFRPLLGLRPVAKFHHQCGHLCCFHKITLTGDTGCNRLLAPKHAVKIVPQAYFLTGWESDSQDLRLLCIRRLLQVAGTMRHKQGSPIVFIDKVSDLQQIIQL